MSIKEKGSQEFQPYARLINIIGDQLITNKIVAIMEIIKNSYDADSDNVKVKFYNRDEISSEKKNRKKEPHIIIEDDGDGMDKDKILNVWLKPATPEKLEMKKDDKRFTQKGRIMQGEKGVGRFAIHKIGERIKLFTKIENGIEVELDLNYKDYDPDDEVLYGAKHKSKYKLLSEVKNNWYLNDPPIEISKPKGTIIKIYEVRENWSDKDLENLQKAIGNFLPPKLYSEEGVEIVQGFDVKIFDDDVELGTGKGEITFKDLYERAPYRIEGYIDEYSRLNFKYSSNYREIEKAISFFDNEYFLRSINDRFFEKVKKHGKKEERKLIRRIPTLGIIKFSFLAFDLTKRDSTAISESVRDFVRNNKIYVYRDNIRVYPFGEPDFDWLELDKIRATFKAGAHFSYNDLVGFIYISQKSNPLLKDATNRQGIVDINGTYSDFKALLLAVLEILKIESDIDKFKERVDRHKVWNETVNIIQVTFDDLKKTFFKIDDKNVLEKAVAFLNKTEEYFTIMRDRMETVEDLAGLGMAVEKASHDGLMMLSKIIVKINDLNKEVGKDKFVESVKVKIALKDIEDALVLIHEELQIIQPLFKVSRVAVEDVSINECLQKILRYFNRDLADVIDVKITIKEDIIVKANIGMILQVFINLFDNSIFWLIEKYKGKDKKIEIYVDGKEGELIFADNGIGIKNDITSLVFQEFFTTKPDGRGLGLYIAREILNRIKADISIINEDNKKILKGANFLINFNSGVK